MPHTFAFTDSVAAVAPPFIEIQMIINSTVSSTGLRFLFLILLLFVRFSLALGFNIVFG